MIPEIELKSSQEIKQFQEDELKKLLYYLKDNSTYYQRVFKRQNIQISDINTLEDLQKIPVTTKEDLHRYNDDFICIDSSNIIDYVTTSGTTGNPVFFGLSDKDLERLAYNEAISFACSKVTKNDTIQLMTTIDRRFLAGLAYFLGARKLGAGIIRVGAGIPELQWDSILKFKPSYLIAVPSFLLKLIEYAENNGITVNSSSVKGVICIGEPLKNQDFSDNVLSLKIKEKWDIELYSTYASTEMSTAFSECEFQQGGHHHPELIIVEILDDHNQPVMEGEEGELVVTTLGVETIPLLRFKTGDVIKAHYQPCKCGRNTLRLGPVIGRKKHMIKYKGTTIYPPAMYNLLNDFSAIENYIIELDRNEVGLDNITIKVGTKASSEDLMQRLKDHMRAKLRVLPTIMILSIDAVNKLNFPGINRKPILFVDKRK
jgi:phenylacetate-CoA ligase|tara:strand:+ start:10645 stop:11934 length:1290 start_codon:yes stop_codon:yes gene_type:complete